MMCKARYLKLDLEYSYLNLEVDNRNFKNFFQKCIYNLLVLCLLEDRLIFFIIFNKHVLDS